MRSWRRRVSTVSVLMSRSRATSATSLDQVQDLAPELGRVSAASHDALLWSGGTRVQESDSTEHIGPRFCGTCAGLAWSSAFRPGVPSLPSRTASDVPSACPLQGRENCHDHAV